MIFCSEACSQEMANTQQAQGGMAGNKERG